MKLECEKAHKNVLRKQEDEERFRANERQNMDAIRENVNNKLRQHSLKQEDEAKRIREEFDELLNKCKKMTDCQISKYEQVEKNVEKLTEDLKIQTAALRDIPGIVRQYGQEAMTKCSLKWKNDIKEIQRECNEMKNFIKLERKKMGVYHGGVLRQLEYRIKKLTGTQETQGNLQKEPAEGGNNRNIIIEDSKSTKRNKKCAKRRNESSSEGSDGSDDERGPRKGPSEKPNYRRDCKCGCKDMGDRMTKVEKEVYTLMEIVLTITASEREDKKGVQKAETIQKLESSKDVKPQMEMREGPTKSHWSPEVIPSKTGTGAGRYEGGISSIVCYNCQGKGHRAMECQARKCYVCGKTGHISRECGENFGGTKYRSMECYSCGRLGHLSRECKGYRGYDETYQNKYKTCYKCGEAGHIMVNCKNKRESRPNLNGNSWKQSDF
jgi:cellular nucleic acid-binding protein